MIRAHTRYPTCHQKASRRDSRDRSRAKFRSQTSSKLLELPPELRNRIWALALIEDEVIVSPSAFPALLHTCRQTREEAKGISFSTNTFHIAPEMDKLLRRPCGPCNLFKWLEVVDKTGYLSDLSRVFVTRGLPDNWYGSAGNLIERPKNYKANLVHIEMQTFDIEDTWPYYWEMIVSESNEFSGDLREPLFPTRFYSEFVNRPAISHFQARWSNLWLRVPTIVHVPSYFGVKKTGTWCGMDVR